jgi:glycosyltransferase involved in cell wall biosynthesis
MERKTKHAKANGKASVALINPVGGHSGAHYYDFGLCRGLLAAGCHVSLYTCDETADPSIPGLGFFPLFKQIYQEGNHWIRMKRYIAGTVSVITTAVSSGESICHFEVFNSVLRELFVILVARLFRRKVILTVHDVSCLVGPQTGKKMISGWTYRLADRLIVHNRASIEELEGIHVPLDRISVIPHGNYLDSMRELPPQEEARKSLEIDSSSKVVLFFGQIKEVKGLDILIEAMPSITREIPEVVFLIVGRPWRIDFSIFDALIDKLKMRKQCRIHIGYVPDDDVAKYYSAADVVVLPYRRIYQSGVLIMAMTYGRAVVVSNLPGMTEMVTDGTNGYVFTQGSKDELALAVVRALRDDEERQMVAACASEYIREHHDWSRIGRQTTELYEAVLGH